MREIKFRGWDKYYEKLTYFDDEDYEYKPPFVFRLDQVFKKDSNYDDYEDFEYNDITDKVEIMQYTGLHDKNGKEIYEGDIVKRSLRDKEDERIYFEDFYVIIFDKAAFQYKGIKEYYISETGEKWGQKGKETYRQDLGSNFGVSIKNIEVIGNIYENKELLNETNR